MQNVKFVKNVHDLHIWSLSHGKPGKFINLAMSAHMHSANPEKTLKKATKLCR